MTWQAQVFIATVSTFFLGYGSTEPSLREAAQRPGLLVGTAVRPAQLSEAAYASTLAREFNMVEPEDALKWEVVHPQPQSYDFSQADQIVDFAIRHAMKVRGHTLVWHQQNPKWLTDAKYSSGDLAQILEQHIKTVVAHYRGKIFAWDVVNEAFDESRPGNSAARSGETCLESVRRRKGPYILSNASAGRMKPIHKRCCFTTRLKRS